MHATVGIQRRKKVPAVFLAVPDDTARVYTASFLRWQIPIPLTPFRGYLSETILRI